MGRKPKASRVKGTANVSGSFNIPLESVQNIFSPTGLPVNKKAAKSMKIMPRRSGRIRKLASPGPNQERVVEEIDLADREGQEEPQIEELSSEPVSSQQNLGEKIDFLVESVREFKSKVTKNPLSSQSQLTEFNYKTLYIDSQKKIEALTEENHQMAKELEFARGKAEAFEQMKDFFGNMKDVMLYSNLGRATEAVINLSYQATTGKRNSQIVNAPDAADEPRAFLMKKKKDVRLKKIQ